MTHVNYNYYAEISALNPVLLDIVGLFLCIVFILCIIFNFIMLYLFMHYKEIRSPVNKLVMAIAVMNLFSSFQFPYLIISFFAHKWVWSNIDCVFLGFLNNFVSFMQIYLMTGISYVRYDILNRKLDESTVNQRIILNSFAISFALSFFWSLAPLFGWSYYSLEEGLVSCSTNYTDQSWNVTSYNMAMLLCVYLAPFLFTIGLNMKSICILKNQMKQVHNLKLIAAHRRCLIALLIYVGAFLIKRVPFSLVIVYYSFKLESSHNSPFILVVSTLSSILVRSVAALTTLFFILTERTIIRKIKQTASRTVSQIPSREPIQATAV